MRRWGDRSTAVRDTLDPRLAKVMDRVLSEVGDMSLISGFRGEQEQNALYVSKRSRAMYPSSKHNQLPSVAVDFQPYPLPKRKEKLWAGLAYIAGRAIEIGIEEGVALRWGGDWNRDGDLTDNRFDDLFHLEIMEIDPREAYPCNFDITGGTR